MRSSGCSFVGVVLGILLMVGCVRPPLTSSPPAATAPFRNLRYTIEGQPVQLKDGVAETEAAPGPPSRVVTRYLGSEFHKDLNGDGHDDVALLLTQDRGGSGTFYYVVAALQTEDGWIGSHALLLGDRIAPRSITSGPGKSIVVSYAEHAGGEPMAVPPSRERSRQLILDDETLQFGEVVNDFEGEADPGRVTLGMKPWVWIRAQDGDGRVTTPRQPERFSLTLLSDGTFSASTDCNRVRGSYTIDQDSISFGSDMASSRMYCEGSQEAMFISLLQEAQRFHFTSRGELIFDLKSDRGVIVFR